jgi:hypothetical protein
MIKLVNLLKELDLPSIIASKTPVEDLDKELGTNLAKKYIYPTGYPEDYIDKVATSIKVTDPKFDDPAYQEKIDEIYTALVQMNRSSLGGIKADTHQKKRNVIIGVTHHINPNDIKFFVEDWETGNNIAGNNTPAHRKYFEDIQELEIKYDVPINWVPSPNSFGIIKQAIDKKFNK